MKMLIEDVYTQKLRRDVVTWKELNNVSLAKIAKAIGTKSRSFVWEFLHGYKAINYEYGYLLSRLIEFNGKDWETEFQRAVAIRKRS